MLPGAEPTAADAGSLIGRLVADRYRVLSLLGEGGMGAVYKAEHVGLRKVVALKVIRDEWARQPDVAARFQREAVVTARLSHPNCVVVTDFGATAAGELFLAMELLEGHSLADELDARGRLPVPEVLAIGRQILGALACAQEQSIVHRDVKPANVMLLPSSDGPPHVKVIDFGIAKLLDHETGPQTQAGMIVGTPDYLAPERAYGGGATIDGRADLYAVGCLLHEMVTGQPPFSGQTPQEVVLEHLTRAPRPSRQVAPDAGISEALEAVILRALEKQPQARFQTATAMLESLEAVAQGTSSQPSSGSPHHHTLPLPPAAPAAEAPAAEAPAAAAPAAVRPAASAPAQADVPSARAWVPASAVAGVPAARRRSGVVLAAWLAWGRIDDRIDAWRYSARRGWARRRTRLGVASAGVIAIACVAVLVSITAARPPGRPATTAPGRRMTPSIAPAAVVGADALDQIAALEGQGEAAVPRLAATAAGSRDRRIRAAAIEALGRMGFPASYDRVAATLLELDQAPPCRERRDAVRALARLGDRRAVAPLRAARDQRRNGCLVADVGRALRALEQQDRRVGSSP